MKKIIIFCLIFIFNFAVTFSADLGKINVLNNGNIELESKDIKLPSGEILGDLKILKDYEVSFSSKDKTNQNIVKLNLVHDLEKNKDYTILGIEGAEANMSFSIKDQISGEYLNSKKEKGLSIEKINILDSKTIEIYYTENLKSEDFLYKFLSEVEISGKNGDGNSKLNISLKNPLEENSSYIIISTYLEDIDGKKQEMKEVYYDFKTSSDLENIFGEKKVEEKIKDTGNIEEVAQNLKVTPQTGTKTWIFIVLALLLAFSFFTFRKKA